MADKPTPEKRLLKENVIKAKKQLQKALDKIREKTVKELRNDEIRFLKARRSYLTLDDKEKYASVLKEKAKDNTPEKGITNPKK